VVVHAYNPSYSGSGDPEDSVLRPAPGYKKTPISKNNPGMVVHIYNPKYLRGIGRRIMV
jgi:hypothetical protein